MSENEKGEIDGDDDVDCGTVQRNKRMGSNKGRRGKKMSKFVDEDQNMNSKVERTGSLITILATPANVRLNTDALFRYERTRRIRYIIIEHTTSIRSIFTIAKILFFTHYICFDRDL